MKYGDLPTSLGTHEVDCREMMFYQYLPIKMKGDFGIKFEDRLDCFKDIIQVIYYDFIDSFGEINFLDHYIYVTAKHLYQSQFCSFNRPGLHSDGFMTDDINYIWCNKYPTIFNKSNFDLSMDDKLSLEEMALQAIPDNDIKFKENELLRLNQFNIHRVDTFLTGGMRAFLKVSFSKDKYDLIGNSHNYLMDYNWDMRERKQERNIPQSILTK